MDLKTAIDTASKARYTATETKFFENNPQLRQHGILLNPGELALSVAGFIQFVEDGCKNPSKYKMGDGFRAVRPKDICDLLAELYEAQRSFVQPVHANAKNAGVWNLADLTAYEQRAREIAALQEELIEIVKRTL